MTIFTQFEVKFRPLMGVVFTYSAEDFAATNIFSHFCKDFTEDGHKLYSIARHDQ